MRRTNTQYCQVNIQVAQKPISFLRESLDLHSLVIVTRYFRLHLDAVCCKNLGALMADNGHGRITTQMGSSVYICFFRMACGLGSY
jgi:hypothetical protein